MYEVSKQIFTCFKSEINVVDDRISVFKVNSKHTRTMSFVTYQNDLLIVIPDLLVFLLLTLIVIRALFIMLIYIFVSKPVCTCS